MAGKPEVVVVMDVESGDMLDRAINGLTDLGVGLRAHCLGR